MLGSSRASTHGFDMGKLTPSSLFYLPCQAENPAHSFFIDHNSPGRSSARSLQWAGYAANHHRPEPELVGDRCRHRHADRRRTSAATDAADRLPQAEADARDDRG